MRRLGLSLVLCLLPVLGHAQDKAETLAKYGEEQFMAWRRSYDTPPPPLEAGDPRSERGDLRYAGLAPEQIPLTECLKDTVARVLPMWNEVLAPAIPDLRILQLDAHPEGVRAQMNVLKLRGKVEVKPQVNGPILFRWLSDRKQ